MPAEVFLNQEESHGVFLAERLLEAGADSVIWISPDRKGQESLHALQDNGIRIVGLCDTAFPPIRCRYEVRKDHALQAIFREWRRCGVESCALVYGPGEQGAMEESQYRLASEDEGLSLAAPVFIDQNRVRRALASLGRRKTQGLLVRASAAAFFALREPEILWKLMLKQRVALLDGPINSLFAKIPSVSVDLITVDWASIASRIVSDLITQTAWNTVESLTFQAQARLAVTLNAFCQQL